MGHRRKILNIVAAIHTQWQIVRCRLAVVWILYFIVPTSFADNNGQLKVVWPEVKTWQVSESGRLQYVEPKEVETPQFQKHWVEKTRESIAISWRYFNDVVDSYVSQDDTSIINDSYLRLRLGNTFVKGEYKFTFDLKVKADLVRTENRIGLWAENQLNFFLDTNSDDQKTLAEQSLDRTFGDQTDQGATTGFRIEFAERHLWKTDFDLGVKSSAPVDPFTRLTFFRTYDWGVKWKASWRHRFYAYYYRDSGYQTDFKVFRSIAKKWSYTNTSEVQWNHDDEYLGYANISAFGQTISDTSFAVWSFGAFYEDYPKNRLSSYFWEIKYTRRLYKDWFFIELVPRVDYLHVNNYSSTPSFLLRFDVLFSH